MNPSTHTVYVANDTGITVSVIDEATDTVTATIIPGHKVVGTMAADDNGIAACGKYGTHEADLKYDWATGSITFLGTSACTEKGF